MANRSCGNRRQQQVRAVPAQRSTACRTEPAVRRWPHPVDGTEPAQACDPALHYIRCALSYQNQLLCDIKTLLETIAARETAEEK